MLQFRALHKLCARCRSETEFFETYLHRYEALEGAREGSDNSERQAETDEEEQTGGCDDEGQGGDSRSVSDDEEICGHENVIPLWEYHRNVELGCDICSYTQQRVGLGADGDEIFPGRRRGIRDDRKTQDVLFEWKFRPSNIGWLTIHTCDRGAGDHSHVILTQPCVTAHPVFQPRSGATPLDIYEAMISQIRMWLDDDRLARKWQSEPSGRYPARLLHLYQPHASWVRVVEKQADWSVPYVALSYRWPQQDFIKLLSMNQQELMGPGVSTSSLAGTFQDAIRIIWSLGLEFIWIDCLCILQDSPADWAIQSTTMADVYSNAYFTLAVDSYPTDGRTALAHLIDHLAETAQADSSWLFSHGIQTYFADKSVLNRRGWCLQERQLSRRIAHVTPTDIIWEMSSDEPEPDLRTLRHPTRGPTSKTGVFNSYLTDSILRRPARTGQLEQTWRANNSDTEQDDFIASWHRMIEHFTTRQLTYHEDRLAAFSAIATRFSEFIGQAYTLGVLDGLILASLCWQSRMHSSPADRNERLHNELGPIPTWSWASVRRPIEFVVTTGADVDRKYSANVELAKMRWAKPLNEMCDQNDKIKPVAIKAYGLLLPTKLSNPDSDPFPTVEADFDGALHHLFEGLDLRLAEGGGPAVTYLSDLGNSPSSENDNGFLLPLHASIEFPIDISNLPDDRPTLPYHIEYHGLFLKPSLRFSGGGYERHGWIAYRRSADLPREPALSTMDSSRSFRTALEKRELTKGVSINLI